MFHVKHGSAAQFSEGPVFLQGQCLRSDAHRGGAALAATADAGAERRGVEGTHTVSYEVGKWYRVPAVHGAVYEYTRWWPTLGPKHEDAEFIAFPLQHYHIDWRFVPARVFKSLLWTRDESRIWGIPLMEGLNPGVGQREPINHAGLGKPEVKRMKCVRALPIYPIESVRKAWGMRLEAAYAGCKLKPGLICPHRGIPLATIPAVDGIVVCPGHGLSWRVETGELVSMMRKP